MTDPLPDLTRPDAGSIVVSEWTVGTPERQRAAVEATIAQWTQAPWPAGLLSFNAFVSTDGKTVLNYAQWTDDEAHREFIQAPGSPDLARGVDAAVPDIERTDLVRYRLYRSRVSDGARRAPGCVVVADVRLDHTDRERQREVAEALLDTRAVEAPGWVSTHLHLSTDGTRVLDYAEWIDERACVEASASRGGTRYRLLRSIGSDGRL